MTNGPLDKSCREPASSAVALVPPDGVNIAVSNQNTPPFTIPPQYGRASARVAVDSRSTTVVRETIDLAWRQKLGARKSARGREFAAQGSCFCAGHHV